jgi:hypothetical protein
MHAEQQQNSVNVILPALQLTYQQIHHFVLHQFQVLIYLWKSAA